MKILHSWLFMPINQEHFIRKILSLKADIYILDLEDAVHKESKLDARNRIKTAIEFLQGKVVGIRINHFNTQWGKYDLEQCYKNKVKYVVYPKVNSSKDWNDFVSYNYELSNSYKFFPELVPAIETLSGVVNANEIFLSDSFKYFIFGSEDFMVDFPLSKRMFIQSNALLTKAMVDLAFLSSVHKKFLIDCANPYYSSGTDLNLFKSECEYSASIGAVGKAVIHPKQIDIVNTVYGEVFNNIDEIFLTKVIQIVALMSEQKKSVIDFKGRMYGIPELKKISNLIEYKFELTGGKTKLESKVLNLIKRII